MAQRTCAVDGCERRYSCKGYCQLHYTRMRTKGTIDAPVRRYPPRLRKGDDRTRTKTCPTCGEAFTFERARGVSNKRYCSIACWQPNRNSPDSPPCPEVDGDEVCGRPWRTPGIPLCDRHYQRKLKYGNTELRRRVPTGSCWQCGIALGPKHRFYCSEECGYLHRNGYQPKTDRQCIGCGVALGLSATRKQVYCTKDCQALTRRFMRYGATLEQARDLRGVVACEICGSDAALAIDHCHSSRKIRGMLCQQCNVGIGMFRDDEALLRRAIQYLKR